MKLVLSCRSCGSKDFIKPRQGELADHEVITCAGCGRKTTAGETRKQALEAGKKLITDRLSKAFRKR